MASSVLLGTMDGLSFGDGVLSLKGVINRNSTLRQNWNQQSLCEPLPQNGEASSNCRSIRADPKCHNPPYALDPGLGPSSRAFTQTSSLKPDVRVALYTDLIVCVRTGQDVKAH